MQDSEAKWAAKWERAAAALAEATTRLSTSESKRLQASERSQESTIALMRSLEKQRELEAALSDIRNENAVLKADVEALCHGSLEPPSRVRTHAPSEMTMDELQDMVVGLEERLAKQSALASHWKGEAFRWAQQAESEAIADASASIAWASSATKDCARDAAEKHSKDGVVSPPPVPVAWLQSELRSTMAALEASREREASLISQLADARSVQPQSSTNGEGSHVRTTPGRQNSPMDSRDGRAAVAALSKLERTLGVDPTSRLPVPNETAAATVVDLDGWKWLTARLIRLTSVLDGKPRAGIQYTPRKSEPEASRECAPGPDVSATAAAADDCTMQRNLSPEMRILKYELLQKSSTNLDQADVDVCLYVPDCAAFRALFWLARDGWRCWQALIQRMDAAEEVVAHAERSRWLAMEAFSLRMKVTSFA
jgi:hypothetical protein